MHCRSQWCFGPAGSCSALHHVPAAVPPQLHAHGACLPVERLCWALLSLLGRPIAHLSLSTSKPGYEGVEVEVMSEVAALVLRRCG